MRAGHIPGADRDPHEIRAFIHGAKSGQADYLTR